MIFILLVILILWCLAVRLVSASSFNPLITNGTCYFKAGEQMVNQYSPCGNAALSNYWCCQLGDACASENACYNFGTGTTYLAGCTDPDYEDVTCPNKGPYSDQQWTGLVRCHVSDDFSKQQELWAACADDEQPLVVVSNLSRSCQCDNSSPDFTTAVVFTAGPGLVNYATLPEQKGKSIMWAAGMAPTTFEFTGSVTSTAAVTASDQSPSTMSGNTTNLSTTSTPAATAITSSNAPPTSTSTQLPPGPFSTGMKVGIAMSALVVVALSTVGVGIVVILCMRGRRTKKKNLDNISDGSQDDKKGGPGEGVTQHISLNDIRSNIPATQPMDGVQTIHPHVAEVEAGLDGTRSSWRNNRDSSNSVSAISPSLQDGRSSTYTRDGSRVSWTGQVAASNPHEQNYQYQPYRREGLDAQNKLPEIAELPASEQSSRRLPHTESVSQSNDIDDELPHVSTLDQHQGTTQEFDVQNTRAPSHCLPTRKQEVFELPG